MNNAPGLDVSKWDVQPIDFRLYAGVFDFVSVKVSEGSSIDPLFHLQWDAAHGKVVRFPYHFWRAFSDQKLAAQKVVEYLGLDIGELEVALDMEVSDGATDVMVRAKVWIDEYHRLTGFWPMIYSTRAFLHEHGADYQTMWERLAGTYHNAWLSNCKLWLAEWPFDELDSLNGYTEKGDALRAVLIREVVEGKRTLAWPKPIPPFKQVDFWQWTSRLSPDFVPGYYMGTNPKHKEAVDANFSILTREQFREKYPIGYVPPNPPPIPIPPDTGDAMFTGKVTAAKLNVRPTPDTTQPALYQIAFGDLVTADRKSAQWWHLQTVNGQAVQGDQWASGDYIQQTAETQPPNSNDNLPEVLTVEKTETMILKDDAGNILRIGSETMIIKLTRP